MSFVALAAILSNKVLISCINAVLFVVYSFLAYQLHWFSKREEMIRETVGFKYLFRFFVTASFNRLTAALFFIPGFSWLVTVAYTFSIIYACLTAKYFYQNRHGILLAVSLRRKLIDAEAKGY